MNHAPSYGNTTLNAGKSDFTIYTLTPLGASSPDKVQTFIDYTGLGVYK